MPRDSYPTHILDVTLFFEGRNPQRCRTKVRQGNGALISTIHATAIPAGIFWTQGICGLGKTSRIFQFPIYIHRYNIYIYIDTFSIHVWYVGLHERLIFIVNVGKYTIHGWYVIYIWNFQMPIYQVTRLVFLHPNIWNEGLVYDLGANFKTKKVNSNSPGWFQMLLFGIFSCCFRFLLSYVRTLTHVFPTTPQLHHPCAEVISATRLTSI